MFHYDLEELLYCKGCIIIIPKIAQQPPPPLRKWGAWAKPAKDNIYIHGLLASYTQCPSGIVVETRVMWFYTTRCSFRGVRASISKVFNITKAWKNLGLEYLFSISREPLYQLTLFRGSTVIHLLSPNLVHRGSLTFWIDSKGFLFHNIIKLPQNAAK